MYIESSFCLTSYFWGKLIVLLCFMELFINCSSFLHGFHPKHEYNLDIEVSKSIKHIFAKGFSTPCLPRAGGPLTCSVLSPVGVVS